MSHRLEVAEWHSLAFIYTVICCDSSASSIANVTQSFVTPFISITLGRTHRAITDHTNLLRALYEKVSSTIDAQSVAREMFQSNALTLKELQSIQSRHSEPVTAAERLLNIVMNQSGNVYSCFLDALKKTGPQHVFEAIVSDSYKGT